MRRILSIALEPISWIGAGMDDFSDYVIYADESGDHSLTSIDPDFPLFVLTLCIFRKSDYVGGIVPAVQALKFRWFGHDMVVLHEREIRKHSGAFGLLENTGRRTAFMAELSEIVRSAQFTIIGVIIDKRRLADRYGMDSNPYTYALRMSMERLHKLMLVRGQGDRITHCVFERRGGKEDLDLEVAFRRIVDGDNYRNERFPELRIIFADKKANSTGLQIADLTARPIGIHHLRPEQANRAYEIIRTKLRRNWRGEVMGVGLKIFP